MSPWSAGCRAFRSSRAALTRSCSRRSRTRSMRSLVLSSLSARALSGGGIEVTLAHWRSILRQVGRLLRGAQPSLVPFYMGQCGINLSVETGLSF